MPSKRRGFPAGQDNGDCGVGDEVYFHTNLFPFKFKLFKYCLPFAHMISLICTCLRFVHVRSFLNVGENKLFSGAYPYFNLISEIYTSSTTFDFQKMSLLLSWTDPWEYKNHWSCRQDMSIVFVFHQLLSNGQFCPRSPLDDRSLCFGIQKTNRVMVPHSRVQRITAKFLDSLLELTPPDLLNKCYRFPSHALKYWFNLFGKYCSYSKSKVGLVFFKRST